MQSWLGTVATLTTRGGGRVEFVNASVGVAVRFFEGATGVVLAGGSGNVGGMVVAGVALVVLGLAGVAVWRFGVSSLLGASESAGRSTAPEQATGAETPPSPSQSEGATGEQAERPDREIIVDILKEQDGRMKQARIVDETGWSKSKVSMLLSDMEDDGEISKLRVGRENIVSLEGNEPEAAGSPFDDE